MQISSRFTIAVHMLACMDVFGKDYKVTSEFMAGSIQVNPVIIRNILRQLKVAGLVTVKRGSGGASVARPLEEITLLDVYHAVECVENGKLFHFHENPNPACPVGRNIHRVLDGKLDEVQKAMEDKLDSFTLADVTGDIVKLLEVPDDPGNNSDRTDEAQTG